MSGPTILGGVGAILILLTLFELMRRRRLREKYALIWAVVAFGMFVAAAFPEVTGWLTDSLGLQVPANLLFFVALIVLMILTLHLSYELGRVEERTRTLAEEVALLRLELASGSAPRQPVDPQAPTPHDPKDD